MNSPAAWLINFAIPVFWPFLRFIVALVSDGRIPVSKRAVLGYGVVVLVTLVTLLVVYRPQWVVSFDDSRYLLNK